MDAAYRKLRKETRLEARELALVRDLDRWVVYEVPSWLRSKKTGLGQAQWWFLFEHRAEAKLPDIAKAATKEFRAGEWVSFDEAVRRAVDFKRPIYEELRAEFG